jgi:hypothetical protein
MIKGKQLTVFSCIIFFVVIAIAAVKKPRNLKVLPQDISIEMLDSIMHSYNKALGVNCSFCHVEKFGLLNTESDENPMKDEARKMMRLTIGLNRDYFYYDSTKRPEYLNVVSCITCHRGDPMPADLK